MYTKICIFLQIYDFDLAQGIKFRFQRGSSGCSVVGAKSTSPSPHQRVALLQYQQSIACSSPGPSQEKLSIYLILFNIIDILLDLRQALTALVRSP